MVSMNRERLTERLYLIAPKSLAWVREDLPPVGPHDVLLQTHAGAISIGSELPVYAGVARVGHPPQYPRSMGYENVGIVVACGSAVQRHTTHLEQLFELVIVRDELISTFEQLAEANIHPIKVFVSYNTIPGISTNNERKEN